MKDFSRMSLDEFVKSTSDATPTPGGGAAGAVTGALAAALARMVAGLTRGKKGYEEYESEMERLMEEMGERQQKILNLLNEDVEAFDGVMDALKMPKDTPEAKEKRRQKLQEALKKAAEVPFELARCARTIIQELEPLADWGNSNALSDVASSAHLARAAFLIAKENVKINLRSIKDEEFVAGMKEELEELEKQVEAGYTRVMNILEERMKD